MKSKNKKNDPMPMTFATPEDAGKFWDSHSTMDYAKYLEPIDDVIEIKQRVLMYRLWKCEAVNVIKL